MPEDKGEELERRRGRVVFYSGAIDFVGDAGPQIQVVQHKWDIQDWRHDCGSSLRAMCEELLTGRLRDVVWHDDLFRLEDAKKNNFGGPRLAGEGTGVPHPASPKSPLAVRVGHAGEDELKHVDRLHNQPQHSFAFVWRSSCEPLGHHAGLGPVVHLTVGWKELAHPVSKMFPTAFCPDFIA